MLSMRPLTRDESSRESPALFSCGLIRTSSRVCTSGLAGETPENVPSNWLRNVCSHVRPLQIVLGDFPAFTAALTAAVLCKLVRIQMISGASWLKRGLFYSAIRSKDGADTDKLADPGIFISFFLLKFAVAKLCTLLRAMLVSNVWLCQQSKMQRDVSDCFYEKPKSLYSLIH